MLFHRLGDRPDHSCVLAAQTFAVFAHGLAVDSHCIGIGQKVGCQKFANHGRHTTCMLIILSQIFSRGLHVDDQRYLVANALPVVVVQRHAKMARNPIQVNRRVGRPTDGRVDDNRIFKRLARHDVGGAHIFPHHIDDTPSCFIGHLPAFAVGRGDCSRAGQLHAKRLGQRIHCRGRTHRVAIPNRRGGRRDKFHKSVIIDFAGCQHFTCFPYDGTGTCALPPEPTVQHWADGQRDSGDIDCCSSHQQRRRGFIAPDV